MAVLRARFIRGPLLVLGFATTAPPTVAAPLFSAPFLSFDTGYTSVSVAVADLNGDGRLDLATANYGIGPSDTIGGSGPTSGVDSSSVSVLLGNGDGTFGPRTNFCTGVGPLSVAIADLNTDGRPDLVTANQRSNNVSVLLGHGDGTFGTKTDFDTASFPQSVAIADLNGDGRPDLVAPSGAWPDTTVTVLLGNGDGTFGPRTDFGTGTAPRSVAIGDLNADGRPDLAIANGTFPGTVSVLLGNGDGTFGPNTDFALGNGPSSVAIADLNADGRSDLAVTNSYAVSVLLGNGDGTFGPKADFGAGHPATTPFGTDGEDPQAVAIGDLNADGRPDLATANVGFSSYTVSVLLGQGDGTFAPQTYFETGSIPRSVAIADFDTDGRLDLATANSHSNTVSVLLGKGDGTFGLETKFATATNPLSVAVADLNADGRPDLALSASFFNSRVSVLLGNGEGTFGPKTDFPTGSGPPYGMAMADLNADGRSDLATANAGANTVSVFLGNGDGTFGPKTDFGTGSFPFKVAIADLNADSRPDLVTANDRANTVSVLLGNGDGSFGPRTDFGAGNFASFVAIGDFSSDGRPDLAVGGSGPVSVLLGKGDGTFEPKTEVGTQSGVVAIADLNADGRLDLVTSVSVLLGNGDGTFGPSTPIGSGIALGPMAIADMNADGRADLAGANEEGNTVSVLLGNGDGTFGPKTEFGTGGSTPVSVAIADLNADGRPDLASANLVSSTVSVLLNLGPPTFPLTPMSFDLSPSTITLHSKGKWVTAMLEPEPPASPGEIDIASIILNRNVPVDPSAPTSMGDADHDGRPDLTVKFDRAAVELAVEEGEAVTVTVAGEIGSGRFEATDVIRVVGSHLAAPRAGAVLQAGSATEVLALHGSVPNPGRNLNVSFSLPADGGPAVLVVYDVHGREVARREVGSLGVGGHVVALTAGRTLARGIYFVSLTQGERRLVARAVVIR